VRDAGLSISAGRVLGGSDRPTAVETVDVRASNANSTTTRTTTADNYEACWTWRPDFHSPPTPPRTVTPSEVVKTAGIQNWLRGTVIELRSVTSELSLSYARLADG